MKKFIAITVDLEIQEAFFVHQYFYTNHPIVLSEHLDNRRYQPDVIR